MPNKDWPDVAPGSIIAFTGRATRGSEGETREIFALVMSQEPFDGSLTCFAFHFEGQFQAVLMPVNRTPVRGADGTLERMDVQPTFRMVFDAGLVGYSDGQVDLLKERFSDLQRQMTEFQTQVLEMITSSSASDTAAQIAASGLVPADVDSTRKRK